MMIEDHSWSEPRRSPTWRRSTAAASSVGSTESKVAHDGPHRVLPTLEAGRRNVDAKSARLVHEVSNVRVGRGVA